MAKISLREYNHYVEQLIKQGNTDEAIAHCRYILKIFPKHIDTYRLLGQSFLENQQHVEASDIFKRVLLVVPDDFLSHYGISLISEDEGNLNAAIWHMERAFEVQPSNAAIQADLKRLFGRRDGVEPLKIRLSRGALIRMYVRGELYPQAISEIESGLAEDPQRIDLQVTLARLYKILGRNDKVKDICATLLEKSSYCYEANKIMSEIFPENEAVEYRARLIEIDPYSGFLSDKIRETSQVPDQAVLLEKLEWSPESEEGSGWEESKVIPPSESSEPVSVEWLTKTEGVGEIKFEEANLPAEQPEPDETEEIKPSKIEEPEAEEGVLPDWMQTAGWEKTDRAPESETEIELPFELDEEISTSTQEAIAADDIPDWLKQAQIEEIEKVDSGSEKTILQESIESKIPEEAEEKGVPLDVDLGWLESLAARQGADQETLITSAEERSETPPEWIANLQPSVEEKTIEEQPVDIFGGTTIPESLQENVKEIDEIFASDTSEIPMSGYSDETIKIDRDALTGRITEIPSEESVSEIVPEPIDEAEEAQLPDWLSEATPVTTGIPEAEIPSETIASELEEEELPDWLKEIEKDAEAEKEINTEESEKLPETPYAQLEQEGETTEEATLPDWLKGFAQEESKLEPTIFEGVESQDSRVSDIFEQPVSEELEESVEETTIKEPYQKIGEDQVEGIFEGLFIPPVIPAENIVESELPEEVTSVPELTKEQQQGEITEEIYISETYEEVEATEFIEQIGGVPETIEEQLAKEELKELEELPEFGHEEEMVKEVVQENEKYQKWQYEEQIVSGTGVEQHKQAETHIKAEIIEGVEEFMPLQPQAISTPHIDSAALFESARTELNKNNVDEAVVYFNQLIIEHDQITQVIDEIKLATNNNPYHSGLWQSLGDAFAKNDQLQNALDAYTQAEVLLR